MKKITKYLSLLFVAISIFILAACSSDKTDIKAVFTTPTIKTTEITLGIEFDSNTKLEDGTAKPYISVYDKDDKYIKQAKVSFETGSNTSATSQVASLEMETLYRIKLFVTIDNSAYEIVTAEYTTLSKDKDNSMENPYLVSSISEFKAMSNDAAAHYKLTSDLDFNGEYLASIFTYGVKFTGSFNGDNHTISNFKLTSSSYMGVFGYTSGATIKNLKISNVTASRTSGESYIGVVVGRADKTTFENVSVTDIALTITASTASVCNVGGFAGYLFNSTVKNCNVVTDYDQSVDKPVSTITMTKAQYRTACGLFAGTIEQATEISDSYAKGNIKGTVYYKDSTESTSTVDNKTYVYNYTYFGGFIGLDKAKNKMVSRCYSVCDIDVKEVETRTEIAKNHDYSIGGFVGGNGKYSAGCMNITDCFAVADIKAVIQYPTRGAVGGFVGMANDTTVGGVSLTNCYYLAKTEGINATCKIDRTNVSVSLTVASNNLPDPTVINNIYSYNDKITATAGFVVTPANVSTAIGNYLSTDMVNAITQYLEAALSD